MTCRTSTSTGKRSVIDRVARDGIFEFENLFGHSDGFAFGMEFHTSFPIGTILDNTQETFVGPSTDENRLTQGAITAKVFGRCHGGISTSTISLYIRIHLHQIRPRSSLGNSATFGSDGGNVGRSNHNDPGVFRLLAIVEEEKRMMDMHDDALLLLAANLSHCVVLADFRPIPIGSNCVLALLDLVGDL